MYTSNSPPATGPINIIYVDYPPQSEKLTQFDYYRRRLYHSVKVTKWPTIKGRRARSEARTTICATFATGLAVLAR